MATEKKRLELTTELVGMSGYFCTYWGYAKSDYILHEDMIKEDFEEGYTDIHPDYYWLHFDNEKYMKEISDRTHEFMDEFLSDLLKDKFDIDIEYFAEGYNAPKEYNFRGDRHDFDIVAESFQPVLDYCLEHKDFDQFLRDKYSSRDGFMSFTANNREDLLKDIEDNDMTAWGAVFSFLIDQETHRDDIVYKVIESLGQDMFYTEFVEYEALEEFMEELKSGDFNIMLLDHEWQQALFERELGSIGLIKDIATTMYREHSIEDVVDTVLDKLGMDRDDSKRGIIEQSVKDVFNEIESHNLKLDI